MKNITVAGGDVLGSQIAYQIAANQYHVTVYEINDQAIQLAKDKMIKNAQGYALFKGISEEEAQKIAGKLRIQMMLIWRLKMLI